MRKFYQAESKGNKSRHFPTPEAARNEFFKQYPRTKSCTVREFHEEANGYLYNGRGCKLWQAVTRETSFMAQTLGTMEEMSNG